MSDGGTTHPHVRGTPRSTASISNNEVRTTDLNSEFNSALCTIYCQTCLTDHLPPPCVHSSLVQDQEQMSEGSMNSGSNCDEKREEILPNTVISQTPEDTNPVFHSLNHSNLELNEKLSPNSNFTGNSDSNIPAEHLHAFDNFTQALYSALKTHDPVKAKDLLTTIGTPNRTQNQAPSSPTLPSPPKLERHIQLLQSPLEPSEP